MVATSMMSSGVMRQAEHYLMSLGVSHVLPKLWEVVAFEVSMGPQAGMTWTRRKVAYRYLSLLRDHTNSSHLEDE